MKAASKFNHTHIVEQRCPLQTARPCTPTSLFSFLVKARESLPLRFLSLGLLLGSLLLATVSPGLAHGPSSNTSSGYGSSFNQQTSSCLNIMNSILSGSPQDGEFQSRTELLNAMAAAGYSAEEIQELLDRGTQGSTPDLPQMSAWNGQTYTFNEAIDAHLQGQFQDHVGRSGLWAGWWYGFVTPGFGSWDQFAKHYPGSVASGGGGARSVGVWGGRNLSNSPSSGTGKGLGRRGGSGPPSLAPPPINLRDVGYSQRSVGDIKQHPLWKDGTYDPSSPIRLVPIDRIWPGFVGPLPSGVRYIALDNRRLLICNLKGIKPTFQIVTGEVPNFSMEGGKALINGEPFYWPGKVPNLYTGTGKLPRPRPPTWEDLLRARLGLNGLPFGTPDPPEILVPQ
jgi:hypothetical protein